MDYKTFLAEYWNQLNPKTGMNYSLADMLNLADADSAPQAAMNAMWSFFASQSKTFCTKNNRAPSIADLTLAWQVAHPLIDVCPGVGYTWDGFTWILTGISTQTSGSNEIGTMDQSAFWARMGK